MKVFYAFDKDCVLCSVYRIKGIPIWRSKSLPKGCSWEDSWVLLERTANRGMKAIDRTKWVRTNECTNRECSRLLHASSYPLFGHWPKIDHMNASNVNEGGILPTFPLRILVQTSFPSYSQLLGFETTKHSTFIIRKAAPWMVWNETTETPLFPRNYHS